MKTIKTMFFKKAFWIALLVNSFLMASVTTVIAHEQHPNILMNAEEIATIRARVDAGEQPWKRAYDKMIGQADDALTLPMMSVTFGGQNSSDSNCANVRIFCTGRFYDENADSYDSDNGSWPIGAGVRDLGMAYAFTGDAKYAVHLIKLVKVWAINSTTGMLPRFSNNQSRISLMPSMSSFIYGVGLAWNYPGWEQADKDAFKSWVLTFGSNAVYAFGQSERNAADNNFENWRNAFLGVAGAFTGDQDLLDTAYWNFKKAITWQVGCGGRMGQEYSRTAGWAGRGYSLYAMHAMTITAEVARHQGVDLYNYATEERYRDWRRETREGNCGSSRGLKTILDYHAPFFAGTESWPGFIIAGTPLNSEHGMGIYELAYSIWGESQYLDVVNEWGRPLGTNNWPLGVVTLTHGSRDLTLTPTPPGIVTQPESVTVMEGENAHFSVVASGGGLNYQWFRGMSSIEGATAASYTVMDVNSSDNGNVYRCVINNSEGNISSESVTLSVLQDSIAPVLVSAFTASDSRVNIVFSEPVSVSSAQAIANYQIDPDINVTGASLSDDSLTVSLSVSPLTLDTAYTVQVSNVQDRAETPNTIVTQSNISFTYRTADNFDDGAAGWSPLTLARWSVEVDRGDNAYYLDGTAGYSSPGGGRLGEYSLLQPTYGDFTLTAQARLVGSAANADYAVVFGFQDADNYYYMMFNNNQNFTQLFKVVNGNRDTALATATNDWLNDDLYHDIEISRVGNEIKVSFDGSEILSAADSTFGAGKVGVGSYNDSTYFDDIRVVNGGGGNRAPTSASASITTDEDTQSAGVTAAVTDPDAGDTHSISLISQPGDGTATVVDNKLVYEPGTGFSGADSFVFRATDEGGLFVNGTASVTVVAVTGNTNHAPTFASASITTDEDTQSAGVTAAVTDPDVGDTHSISLISQPGDGTATVVDNKLVYEPGTGFSGADSFVFRATDEGGLFVNGTASVTVVESSSGNAGGGSTGGGGALSGWLLVLMLGFRVVSIFIKPAISLKKISNLFNPDTRFRYPG